MKALPSGTYILALAQALNLTAAVMSVTISAFVGSLLADEQSLSTVPYGLQFAAVMLFSFPASWLMKRYGRKKIFYIGGALLFFAGLIGFHATQKNNFFLLAMAHFVLGTYISIANFYRFAATDFLDGKGKANAISLVVAGGVLAAILGPSAANLLKSVDGYSDFSLCYASMSLMAILTMILIYFWNQNSESRGHHYNQQENIQSVRIPYVILAIITSSWGYLSMNLLMVQASVYMRDICAFDKASDAIQAHVLAMFLPSFFAGYFIRIIGEIKFILAGYGVLSIACVLSLIYFSYASIYWALIILGIGWNVLYVGGGALLSRYVNDVNQHKWQGINDTVIASCATIGAFMPAPMFVYFGWEGTNELMLLINVLLGFGAVVLIWFCGKNKPVGVPL